MIKNIKSKLSMALMVISLLATSAVASITTDLENFSAIIGNSSSGFTSYFVNMMTVFMQPPLVYFVVLGIFITFIHLVGSFLMKRGKK